MGTPVYFMLKIHVDFIQWFYQALAAIKKRMASCRHESLQTIKV